VYRQQIKKENLRNYQQEHVVAAGRHQRRFTIGWLDVEKQELKDVVMDTFGSNGRLTETISAQRAVYSNGLWMFYEGKHIVYDPEQPGLFQEANFREQRVIIEESPEDFALQDQNPDDMTAGQIVNRIKRLKELGVPVNREEVALQMKIALPFAHVVVIALAIPFALRSNQQSKVQTFGYALVMAFLYWGAVSVFQSVGEQGHLPAWLAAWSSNFIFAGVAFGLFQKALR
jgi:lipopolysaccharide export system permease protein